MNAQYQVIFTGQLREGFPPQDVKQAFSRFYRLPVEDVETRLFTGQPVVLKDTTDLSLARRVHQACYQAGAVCEMKRVKPQAPQSPAAAPQPAASPAPQTRQGIPWKPLLWYGVGVPFLISAAIDLVLITSGVLSLHAAGMTTEEAIPVTVDALFWVSAFFGLLSIALSGVLLARHLPACDITHLLIVWGIYGVGGNMLSMLGENGLSAFGFFIMSLLSLGALWCGATFAQRSARRVVSA